MKDILVLVSLVCFLSSCNVTESIVLNENGSGRFLVSYEMCEDMLAMSETMGGANSKKEKSTKTMDTTMVFADIMETYKDSVAALPEDKRLAMEAVKDMFMTMNEDEGLMNFGIGLNFNSIDDLKDISEKLKKVQGLNAQSDEVSAMTNNSPLGNFMGGETNKVAYDLSQKGFSRVTTVEKPEDSEEESVNEVFDETHESNEEFIDYFEAAFYTIKLSFPKAVKSISVEAAEFSEDLKTVTYKANWVDYLKDPKLMDVNIKFVDE